MHRLRDIMIQYVCTNRSWLCFCVGRTHKHNADNIWESGCGDGECGDGQPILDEPDLSAASTNTRQRPRLQHDDAAWRWWHQRTGEHDMRGVVSHQPRSLPTISDSDILRNHPATPADAAPTSAACRCWWFRWGSGSYWGRWLGGVTITVSDCCFWSDDALASSVHRKCSGAFRRCTLVTASFVPIEDVDTCMSLARCYCTSCSCGANTKFYVIFAASVESATSTSFSAAQVCHFYSQFTPPDTTDLDVWDELHWRRRAVWTGYLSFWKCSVSAWYNGIWPLSCVVRCEQAVT